MIRALHPADIPAAKAIIDSVGLFPADLLDDMVAPHLGNPQSPEIWLVADAGSGPVGLLYAAPERMTEGTWNNLLLAVSADRHGQGIGTSLLAAVEARLQDAAAHLLLVETSGLPDFARTRAFYAHAGYREIARIDDFYQRGEAKIIFAKPLAD